MKCKSNLRQKISRHACDFLVRKLTGKVWEVQTQLPTRISRVLFTVKGKYMVLLHGFIKKTQATPVQDIELAAKQIDF